MNFTEVKPGRQYFKWLYLKLMLWFFGRAVQAAARVDEEVKAEFAAMPKNYTFCLGAFPKGPYMVVGKDTKDRVKYLGASVKNTSIDLYMTFKSLHHLFLIFTFQESTPVANARDRLFVNGDIPHACAVLRIMDMIQVYLLPKFLAKIAIKRYPVWSSERHSVVRALVYMRAVIGF
jgi:hypothetical protein